MSEDFSQQFNKEITVFAQTNYRNQGRKFGIKLDDRRRHFYVVGKTGMGKTTIMENMVLSDIYAGHGIAVVDPHGDFAEKILDFVPSNRINDVVYFNPADIDNPLGFNILETVKEEHKHLVAAGLMGVFKKIWVDQWSARMEYILNNTILALMYDDQSTLLGINRMYADKKFRKTIVEKVTDPVVKAFWVDEYANWEPRYEREATAAIQNKIGQFLATAMIRNVVAQVKSTFNVRQIMDEGKIFIVNLSKGRIGEDNSRLFGGMIVTKIQLSAMERVDTEEAERRDFFLYVDEFQNFATESFANILSEARKYRLGLVMAHQYIEQLDESVAAAVFGNVGTIVTFRVGATDAEVLAKEYEPHFYMEDLVNLPKYQIYLRLMIDGVASQPFSATTLPPIGQRTGSFDKVVAYSREKYSKKREEIEEKIAKWSGVFKEEVPAGPPKKLPSGAIDTEYNRMAEERAAQKKAEEDKKKQDDKKKGNDKPAQKSGEFSGKPRISDNNSDDGSHRSRSQKRNDRRKNKKQDHQSKAEPDFKKAEDVVIADPKQQGMKLGDLNKNKKNNKGGSASPAS